VVHVNNIAFKR